MQKRALDELCTAFRLARTTRALYVEGRTDARILTAALAEIGRPEIIVYDVDAVNFDSLTSAEYERVGRSNKLKCRKIADVLAECSKYVAGKVLCLVDSDTDLYYNTVISNPFLISTDYADLTLYFAQEAVLRYWMPHVLGDQRDVTEVIGQIKNVCVRLFAVRLALMDLNVGIGIVPDVGKACKFEGDRLSLDLERLIRMTLSASGNMRLSGQLRSKVQEFKKRDDLTQLAQMNGHDFVQVLRYVLIQKGRGRFPGTVPDETIEAFMYAGQLGAGLGNTPLIRNIRGRISIVEV